MDVVVTGGCGFIGGHLVEYLLEKGFKITVIDNLSRSSLEMVKKFSNLSSVELKIIDIREYQRLFDSISGDVVFHLAALTDVVESEVDRSSYWNVNVVGTINVLNTALKKNMKMVYASSAAVYGDLDKPAREDLNLNPINFYGYTKLKAEEKCLEYLDKIDITILRLFNVYGERARAGVVKNFLDSVRNRRPLIVYGDGESVRDFVHVKDVVEAFYKAYINPSSSGKTINIGSGKPVKIGELARFINEKTMVGIIYKESRKNDIRYSVADISSAEAFLNWRPKIDLFEWLSEKLKEL
ncbi:MAG: NAD-dependent epimerase/dehydratase family protein [Aigarchaeota archaeon]|nr:NAD-dependent epimerase/dehydratase family protein [Aigarchaeota archaeon]MCX8193655.1 NAD-dependent epimerase/dehydratase family protein [Nitrososphaeria archaeon]